MTVRPEVVDELNNGGGWDATSEEQAAAAQLRLVARANAIRVLRAKLADIVSGAGLAADASAVAINGVHFNFDKVPYREIVKILGEQPAMPTVEDMRARFGDDWPTVLGTEASLPVATVRDLYGQIPPR